MINSEYGVGARKFIPDLVKYYEISLVDYIPVSYTHLIRMLLLLMKKLNF